MKYSAQMLIKDADRAAFLPSFLLKPYARENEAFTCFRFSTIKLQFLVRASFLPEQTVPQQRD